MEKELLELIENYPKQLNWKDVRDFDNFNERVSAVDCIVVNTIGVSNGFVEFIPDNNPPLKEEILLWLWAIRPDLDSEIIKIDGLSEELTLLLKYSVENNLQAFWNEM